MLALEENSFQPSLGNGWYVVCPVSSGQDRDHCAIQQATVLQEISEEPPLPPQPPGQDFYDLLDDNLRVIPSLVTDHTRVGIEDDDWDYVNLGSSGMLWYIVGGFLTLCVCCTIVTTYFRNTRRHRSDFPNFMLIRKTVAGEQVCEPYEEKGWYMIGWGTALEIAATFTVPIIVSLLKAQAAENDEYISWQKGGEYCSAMTASYCKVDSDFAKRCFTIDTEARFYSGGYANVSDGYGYWAGAAYPRNAFKVTESSSLNSPSPFMLPAPYDSQCVWFPNNPDAWKNLGYLTIITWTSHFGIMIVAMTLFLFAPLIDYGPFLSMFLAKFGTFQALSLIPVVLFGGQNAWLIWIIFRLLFTPITTLFGISLGTLTPIYVNCHWSLFDKLPTPKVPDAPPGSMKPMIMQYVLDPRSVFPKEQQALYQRVIIKNTAITLTGKFILFCLCLPLRWALEDATFLGSRMAVLVAMLWHIYFVRAGVKRLPFRFRSMPPPGSFLSIGPKRFFSGVAVLRRQAHQLRKIIIGQIFFVIALATLTIEFGTIVVDKFALQVEDLVLLGVVGALSLPLAIGIYNGLSRLLGPFDPKKVSLCCQWAWLLIFFPWFVFGIQEKSELYLLVMVQAGLGTVGGVAYAALVQEAIPLKFIGSIYSVSSVGNLCFIWFGKVVLDIIVTAGASVQIASLSMVPFILVNLTCLHLYKPNVAANERQKIDLEE